MEPKKDYSKHILYFAPPVLLPGGLTPQMAAEVKAGKQWHGLSVYAWYWHQTAFDTKKWNHMFG